MIDLALQPTSSISDSLSDMHDFRHGSNSGLNLRPPPVQSYNSTAQCYPLRKDTYISQPHPIRVSIPFSHTDTYYTRLLPVHRHPPPCHSYTAPKIPIRDRTTRPFPIRTPRSSRRPNLPDMHTDESKKVESEVRAGMDGCRFRRADSFLTGMYRACV